MTDRYRLYFLEQSSKSAILYRHAGEPAEKKCHSENEFQWVILSWHLTARLRGGTPAAEASLFGAIYDTA